MSTTNTEFTELYFAIYKNGMLDLDLKILAKM